MLRARSGEPPLQPGQGAKRLRLYRVATSSRELRLEAEVVSAQLPDSSLNLGAGAQPGHSGSGEPCAQPIGLLLGRYLDQLSGQRITGLPHTDQTLQRRIVDQLPPFKERLRSIAAGLCALEPV